MGRKKNLPMDELKDLYENKMWNTTQLANYYGVDSETIRNYLKRSGAKIRSKSGGESKDKNKYKKKKLPIDEIIDLYKNKLWSASDLAKYYSTTPKTIIDNLEKNGVETRGHSGSKKIAMNRPDVKDKTSKTSKENAKSRAEGNFIIYGHEVPSNGFLQSIEQLFDIRIKTNNDTDSHARKESAVEKRNETNLNNYGTTDLMSVPEIRQRAKKGRWINKTDEELQDIISRSKASPEGQISRRLKVKENRWENKTQEELDEIKRKSIETCLISYGFEYATQSPEFRKYLSIQKTDKFIRKHLPNILDYLDLEILDEEWTNAHDTYTFRCKTCGTTFKQVYNEVQQWYNCPTCYPRTGPPKVSKAEDEIYEFLISLGITNIIRSDRSILDSKELDMVLLDYKLAIEFNGLYFHREENKGKKYHLEKLQECNDKGYDLIQIFEDEWAFKKDIVKERIKQILGINNRKQTIYPRNCDVVEISTNLKDDFLETFHLLGHDISPIRIGAFFDDRLVGVMTFRTGNILKGSKPKEGEYELSRYCIDYNYHIPGLAGKLLNYFATNYQWKKIFTYADKRWSTGGLYSKLGFNYVGDSEPNDKYIRGLKRVHRFALRKDTDPPDVPEWQLRLQEGYHRIWDCGNMKFEMVK